MPGRARFRVRAREIPFVASRARKSRRVGIAPIDMTVSAAAFRGARLVPFLLLALGCTAEVSGKATGSPGAAGTGAGGSSSTPTTQVTGDVGSIPIHQVSPREYNNTVRDLLGTSLKPGDGFQAFEAAGFDTLAAAGVMNSRKVADYFSAAATLAQDLFADPARRDAIVTCQPSAAGDTTCAGINRHVVGVQVPAGKEIANPS